LIEPDVLRTTTPKCATNPKWEPTEAWGSRSG
jgi:hypothetical protein